MCNLLQAVPRVDKPGNGPSWKKYSVSIFYVCVTHGDAFVTAWAHDPVTFAAGASIYQPLPSHCIVISRRSKILPVLRRESS